MKDNPKILIIIVTWNKKQYVIDLLESIANIDYPFECLDMLVIDNASNDGTVEALQEQFQDIQIICNKENIGGTGGFNTGLAWAFEQHESRYDYLWLLDNDVQVHKKTLSELVLVLERNADVAVCGSTMMQLDYPWRINEMGAFVDSNTCTLQLNRHFEEIQSWREKNMPELLLGDADLSQRLMYCQATMDVDYVAAASLLIRAPVAKQAGLWMDFFIHFDDVEWCLRIAKMGHRVMVSARSLIWHVSAISKVPTWILYYDNRNILYLLEKHSKAKGAVKNAIRWTLKKALYYYLIGKKDIADLHVQAIDDYQSRMMGKKNIQLTDVSKPLAGICDVFLDPDIKKVLLPWTINLQATELQNILTKTIKQRDDLQIYCLVPPTDPGMLPHYQVPGAMPVFAPRFMLFRFIKYMRLRNEFDLIMQSDYQPIIPLSWLSDTILFVNYETFSVRKKPKLPDIVKLVPRLIKQWY